MMARVSNSNLAFVAIERSDAVTIHANSDPTDIQRLDTVIHNPGVMQPNK